MYCHFNFQNTLNELCRRRKFYCFAKTVNHMGRICFSQSFGISSLLFLIAFSSFARRVIFLLFESSAVHTLYSSL